MSPRESSLPLSRFGPILAVQFLGTLGFSLAIPFLVFIVTDLGGATWTYGLVGATYSAFQLGGAPLLGRWSDGIGRRPVLIISQLGTLLAWIVFFVALSIGKTELAHFFGATLTLPLLLVFIARALDGATGGNISVANAYVADLTKDTPDIRQLAFGRMGMAASLGFVIGPAAAGILGGTEWGPRLPILVAAGFAGITTIAIWLGLEKPDGPCPSGPPPGDLLETGLHQQTKPCRPQKKKDGAKSSYSPWRDREVMILIASTFVVFLGFNFFYAGFPVHAVQSYQWSSGELGIFFAILAGMMVVAQGPVLGLVSKYLSNKATFALGMLSLIASFVCYDFGIAYLGAALFALGNGIAWPTFQARVAEAAGEHQGAVQGLSTSSASLASIIGLVGGGALYPILKGNLFLVGAAMFTVVVLLTPVWFRKLKRTPAGA